MSYSQLMFEQRAQIKVCLNLGLNQSDIANLLGVHKSTISREINRNTGRRGYRPKQAQEKVDTRRKKANKNVRFTALVQQRVLFYLKQDWSPEQISNYLSINETINISHETIYKFIWANKQNGGNLYKHLRWRNKKRKKRYGKNDHRGQIKDRISIDERPAIVDNKERIGDWEIDTVSGANHQGALVTAVERKSNFSCISFVKKKQAELVSNAIVEMLMPYKTKVFTITVDNGKEFAMHKSIAQQLEADVYFAHPYSSWERGLNEQVNGLIRQYFPKKSCFKNITKQDTIFVENRLNNRPRKKLKFEKPINVFHNSSVALGT